MLLKGSILKNVISSDLDKIWHFHFFCISMSVRHSPSVMHTSNTNVLQKDLLTFSKRKLLLKVVYITLYSKQSSFLIMCMFRDRIEFQIFTYPFCFSIPVCPSRTVLTPHFFLSDLFWKKLMIFVY